MTLDVSAFTSGAAPIGAAPPCAVDDPFTTHAKRSSSPIQHELPTGENPAQRRIREAKASLESEGQRRLERAARPARQSATRFSTAQAIEWGQARGWTVISVEENRAYEKNGKWHRRLADQKFSMDVIFRAPGIGVVGVQAAGKSERKEHWEKFVGLGGLERAHTVYDACLYIEFERGNAAPIKEERWVWNSSAT